MRFESPVINGLIEDFSTVLLFAVDVLVFKVEFTLWSVLGCAVVGYVVVTITFERANR